MSIWIMLLLAICATLFVVTIMTNKGSTTPALNWLVWIVIILLYSILEIQGKILCLLENLPTK